MSLLDLMEKQCIGCGIFYSIPTEAAITSLYCGPTCKKNHSIFGVEKSSQIFHEQQMNVGENN